MNIDNMTYVSAVEQYLSSEAKQAVANLGYNSVLVLVDEGRNEYTVCSVYWGKCVDLTKGQPNDGDVQVMARVINRCIAEKKLESCFLLPPAVLLLADGNALFLFYGYSRYSKQELNEWLKNESFMDPGQMPNSDITNL